MGTSNQPRSLAGYKFYDFLMATSVVVAVSCMFLALKVTQVGPLTFGAAVLFFPLTYVVSTIVTEVYGYRRERRVIWVCFGGMFVAMGISQFVIAMPPAPLDSAVEMDGHYKAVFATTGRIFFASLTAFLVGEFVTSVAIAKMRVRQQGRRFWRRALVASALGQAVDSAIFYPLAFSGVWSWELIQIIMLTHYAFKVGIVVVVLPVTCRLAAGLQRAEAVNFYDTNTVFNPFGLAADSDGGVSLTTAHSSEG